MSVLFSLEDFKDLLLSHLSYHHTIYHFGKILIWVIVAANEL